ncbi:MAG: hypothetical protein ACO3GP_09045 [Candidatus Limnocylindrus sp.]
MKKQTTKTALSALDFALSQVADEPIRTDEFTAMEFAAKANITHATALYRLKLMTTDGRLIVRSGRINGKATNFYSRPK